MIIGKNRTAVIRNIQQALADADYYRKVEMDDPVLTPEQTRGITNGYLRARKTPLFRCKSFFIRWVANVGSAILNRDTEIVGEVDPAVLREGVLLTSNHFSPLENTIIRHYVRQRGLRRLNVVSQVTNFAMNGVIGCLMNYADTIPLSQDMRYLTSDFIGVLDELLRRREAVLIYPEQEMWFHYRKPRPLKRGAYYFAAKLNRPILSCFVEQIDREETDIPGFRKVRYRLHLLGVLRPTAGKTVKENSEEMCRADYELKKAAYEQAYGRPLTYDFAAEDIAGWTGEWV